MTKAYVINLVRSTARREHIERELESSELEYEIVPAVDGAALSPAQSALVDAEAVARAPDWLRPGIIGAALSHLEVYRRIAASGPGAALVLEDDVALRPESTAVLTAAARDMSRAEVVLLYYRAMRPCSFSTQGAVPLPAGRALMYPVDADPLNAGAAYLITQEAAQRMGEFVVPVRAGPDAWPMFLEHGAIDSLRCVVPKPVGVRTDLKSTIDYLGSSSTPLQRAMTIVSERRIFPVYQLAGLRRRLMERRMSRFSVTSEPPIQEHGTGETGSILGPDGQRPG